MTKAVEYLFRCVCKCDHGITDEQTNLAIAVLNGRYVPNDGKLVYRTVEVAEILGVPLNVVYKLGKCGVLRRVYLPGCSRASGFLAKDVRSFKNNNVAYVENHVFHFSKDGYEEFKREKECL